MSRCQIDRAALAEEAGRCEPPTIFAPGLLRPKRGAKQMRQPSRYRGALPRAAIRILILIVGAPDKPARSRR